MEKTQNRRASILPLLFLVNTCFGMRCGVPSTRRIDCYPATFPMSEAECTNRGCCYSPYHVKDSGDNVPWCFFPDDFASYAISDFKNTDYGFTGMLNYSIGSTNYPPNVISILRLDIYLETSERLHFKITDPSKKRYEVPIDTPDVRIKTEIETKYKVEVNRNGSFTFVVRRASTNTVLFNTSVGPLLFGDQFLQISTSLASSNVYGLGERHGSLNVNTHWHRIPFWAADRPPGFSDNLYGDHPFYMVMEKDGNSHGVFFLNSNAKEAELQTEPALTWRSIGGILDFYIFLGPTPDNVISQYTATVGRPFMPPLWSLGFHLCRWGYNTANVTMDYVTRMRDAGIPQDVQWNDIDYMVKHLDFTYDPHNFDTLPDLLEDLHSHGQHYVMIVDPGISDDQSSGAYPPYDTGLGMGIYVNDSVTGRPARGVVWPGEVSFPDFTNPKTEEYWLQQLSKYHSTIPFDGVWIDMNEPSNFVNGSPDGCSKNSVLNYPPYVPKISGGTLFAKTLCPSTVQHKGMHYDVHSLTGLFEMKATSKALISIRAKRPFVISRSTFPSAGLYGGHWTGDIMSTWEHMRLTIPAILGFNMFGIPLVGADICGFSLSTTEELCTRWSQLGAFYPFSRNHNNHFARAQAPVDFSDATQKIIRKALRQRYDLIPYLYTLFHLSHTTGATVARPLFFEFPHDTDTLSIDTQFMWGSGILITPVLTAGATSVKGYFPAGIWYDIYMNRGTKFESSGQTIDLSAPIQYMPLHVRGGCIIPGGNPGTVTSVKNQFFILAAADEHGNATGTLFWDDGDSLNSFENGDFVLLTFVMQYNRFTISLEKGHEDRLTTMRLSTVIVMGLPKTPSKVTLDGKDVKFKTPEYDQLYITINMPFKKSMTILWM